jgi:hypothetical protein
MVELRSIVEGKLGYRLRYIFALAGPTPSYIDNHPLNAMPCSSTTRVIFRIPSELIRHRTKTAQCRRSINTKSMTSQNALYLQ